MLKVRLTRRWPASVEQRFVEAFGAALNPADTPLTDTELVQAMAETDVLCISVSDRLTAEVIGSGTPRVRLLANYGVGYNHIDLAACRAAGITVTNTPGVLTDATTEIALMLILMTARRAGAGERELRAGLWRGWGPVHHLFGVGVIGKTLGIVGFGRIGQAVARRARSGFDMDVVYASRTRAAPQVEAATGARWGGSIEAVLAEADFVSLHVPGGAETRNLIDAARLAAMKPTAFLINTARGDVVDEPALVAALQAGVIAGAGLDVYAAEPHVPPALVAMDNVVLLPHLGSATAETREAMGMRAFENVKAFAEGRTPPDVVI